MWLMIFLFFPLLSFPPSFSWSCIIKRSFFISFFSLFPLFSVLFFLSSSSRFGLRLDSPLSSFLLFFFFFFFFIFFFFFLSFPLSRYTYIRAQADYNLASQPANQSASQPNYFPYLHCEGLFSPFPRQRRQHFLSSLLLFTQESF